MFFLVDISIIWHTGQLNVSRCWQPSLNLCHFLSLLLPLGNAVTTTTGLTPSGNRNSFQNIVTVQENGVDLLQLTAAGLREEEVYA
jgi:hypothetical protein